MNTVGESGVVPAAAAATSVASGNSIVDSGNAFNSVQQTQNNDGGSGRVGGAIGKRPLVVEEDHSSSLNEGRAGGVSGTANNNISSGGSSNIGGAENNWKADNSGQQRSQQSYPYHNQQQQQGYRGVGGPVRGVLDTAAGMNMRGNV